MSDYELSTIQVIWDAPENPEIPKAALVAIPGNDDNRYYASWGACNAEFKEASDAEKLTLFLAKFIDLVVNEGIEAVELHAVFSQVPQYRRALADVGGFDPEKV